MLHVLIERIGGLELITGVEIVKKEHGDGELFLELQLNCELLVSIEFCLDTTLFAKILIVCGIVIKLYVLRHTPELDQEHDRFIPLFFSPSEVHNYSCY